MTKKRDLKEAPAAAKEQASGNHLAEAVEPRRLTEAVACVKTSDNEVVCGVVVEGGSLGAPSSAAKTPSPTSPDGTVKGNE